MNIYFCPFILVLGEEMWVKSYIRDQMLKRIQDRIVKKNSYLRIYSVFLIKFPILPNSSKSEELENFCGGIWRNSER